MGLDSVLREVELFTRFPVTMKLRYICNETQTPTKVGYSSEKEGPKAASSYQARDAGARRDWSRPATYSLAHDSSRRAQSPITAPVCGRAGTHAGAGSDKKSCIVPEHSHHNEQVTYVLDGALKFWIDGREIVVRAGEVLCIPAHMPHQAEALDDTVELDVFTPPRTDWINRTDQYLRGEK